MKKTWKKLLALGLCLCMCLGMAPGVLAAEDETAALTGDLVLLLTNDMHSNLGTSKIMNGDGSTSVVGGVTRLAAAMAQQRARAEGKTLTLDGGDFSQGTPYQNGYQEGWEIMVMAALGTEYTTLGNHEFDVGDQAVENAWVNAAKNKAALGITNDLPQLITSNMFIKYNEKGEEIAYTDADIDPANIQTNAFGYGQYAETGAVNYAVKEVNGYKVGLFGLEGENSYGYCKNSDLKRMDCVAVGKTYAKYLKEEMGCDIVIAISHCGDAEDKALAEASEGYLDVIQSAHDHARYEKPVTVADTTGREVIIYSSGCYAQNLGVLSLKKGENGWSWVEGESGAITLDERYDYSDAQPTDSDEAAAYHEMAKVLKEYDQALVAEGGYFSKLGLSGVTPETEVMNVKEGYDYWFTNGYTYVQSPVTAFITDAFNYAAKSQVSFVFAGYVRTALYEGPFTVADAFNMQSTGESAVDHSAGSSLLVCDMSGAQLAAVCVFDAMCSGAAGNDLYGGAGTLHTGNLRYNYTVKDGKISCDVASIEVYDPESKTWGPLDYEKAYRTSFTFESSQNMTSLMPMITEMMGLGAIPCAPYDEATKTYAAVPGDNTSQAYYDFWAPYCVGVGVLEGTDHELKAWSALYYYAKSMNGELSDYYTADKLTQTRNPAPVPEMTFTDVPESAVYYDAVQWAFEQGIAKGYNTADRFAPDMTCTRGEAVTFLWRANGCPAPAEGDCPFTDVDRNAYYYNAMLWATQTGVISGYGNTFTFAPNVTCTRAELVTLMHRAAGKPAAAQPASVPGVPAGAYYVQALDWAVEKGIADGDAFTPDGLCTRAEIVSDLYKLYG